MKSSGNKDITHTPIESAYNYETYSEFIKSTEPVKFSSICIFCSARGSIPLLDDGSFRRCSTCRKNFKAAIVS